VQLSTARRAWERWQACAGPWQGWSVCPTLLAPGLAEVTPRPVDCPSARELAMSLAGSLHGRGGVLMVLDLEPIQGVHIAALLYEWRVAHGVLVLPRWPYRHATLPVDGLVHALVAQSARLTVTEHLSNVAFVLDAERTRALARRPASDERADNRYRLVAADLPNLAALRALGIREVRKITPA
jgi:hypothetical protein